MIAVTIEAVDNGWILTPYPEGLQEEPSAPLVFNDARLAIMAVAKLMAAHESVRSQEAVARMKKDFKESHKALKDAGHAAINKEFSDDAA